jgi:multidrug efflux pump subunit AcrB
MDQLARVLRASNQEQGTGSSEAGGRVYPLFTGAYLKDAQEVANLVVGTHNNQPVFVRDVGRVALEPEEYRQVVNHFSGAAAEQDAQADGEAAVTIAIAKKYGSNGVTVANAILDQVESWKGWLIPHNVNVVVTRNYGETANDKVNELLFKLFVATGAVAVLVVFALGIRPAVVVTTVIPVVLLMTIFAAWVMGYSIDRVSLFALIFSIGILVDDAIVVVENIYRRWLMKGETDTDTAVDAVREVGNPTILATFTVIAALLPMGFVTGLMDPYMRPIPVLGSVAMAFSLFAAFVFVPWLAMRIKPSLATLAKTEQREHATMEMLDRVYRHTLIPLMHNRVAGWTFLIVLIVAFFLAVGLFMVKAVTVKMLPLDNKAEFAVVLDMPEGTALGNTVNLARRMSEVLRKLPEVTAVQTYAGTAKPFDFNGMVRHYYLRDQPWQGEVHVQLLHKSQRSRTSHEIATQARALLMPLAREAGARITVAEIPPGPPVIQAVVAEVYGPDAHTRRQVAADLTALFEQVEGLADVDNYVQEPYDTRHFQVDTEKALRRGITVDTIIRNVRLAMGAERVSDVKRPGFLEPTYIVIQVPLGTRADLDRLGDLPIPTPNGVTIPLAELGRFEVRPQDPVIYHKDLRPLEYVVGDAVGRLGAPIYPMLTLEDMLEYYRTPDGVVMSGSFIGPPKDVRHSGFEWGGEWTVTYETFRDMGIAFGIALIAIYILVVGQFKNFVLPAVIMAPIPLTLLGIVPGHLLMGAEFTATSMIGFIALAGIIVRNSILLVDFTIQEIARGVALQEAIVGACKARTRPIVITALALVGGASVILTDPIFQGMAVSLLFGVLVSTILTLLVIPLGCLSAGAYLKK